VQVDRSSISLGWCIAKMLTTGWCPAVFTPRYQGMWNIGIALRSSEMVFHLANNSVGSSVSYSNLFSHSSLMKIFACKVVGEENPIGSYIEAVAWRTPCLVYTPSNLSRDGPGTDIVISQFPTELSLISELSALSWLGIDAINSSEFDAHSLKFIIAVANICFASMYNLTPSDTLWTHVIRLSTYITRTVQLLGCQHV